MPVYLETATGKIHGLHEPTPEEHAALDEARRELHFIVHQLRNHAIYRTHAPSWCFPLPRDPDDC